MKLNMIVFNTKKKAEHYVNYLNSLPQEKGNEWALEQDEFNVWLINGRLVIHHYEAEVLCSASEPEKGYMCCSNHEEYDYVIGVIKKPVCK